MSGKDRENLHHRFRAGTSPTRARATFRKSRADCLTVSRSLDFAFCLGPLNDGRWTAWLVKLRGITSGGVAATTCPTFSSRIGVGQMVLVAGEGRGLVTREYLPGWVLTRRGRHAEPQDQPQSASVSCNHGKTGLEISPGTPNL